MIFHYLTPNSETAYITVLVQFLQQLLSLIANHVQIGSLDIFSEAECDRFDTISPYLTPFDPQIKKNMWVLYLHKLSALTVNFELFLSNLGVFRPLMHNLLINSFLRVRIIIQFHKPAYDS